MPTRRAHRRRRPSNLPLIPFVAASVVIALILVVVTMTSSQSAWGPTTGLPRAAAEVKASPRPTTKAPKPPKHAPPATYGCPGYSGIEKPHTLALLYQDTFVWSTFPAYQIGNGKGNINWRADPYDNPSWYMWMHSLRWLGQGIRAAGAGDRKALARVTTIARDWVKDNPYDWKVDAGAHEATMHRTNVLICLRLAILSGLKVTKLPPAYAWLDKTLLEHAKFMRLNWGGVGNHGTDESIALLGVGCTFARADLKDLAQERLSEAITTAIDKQGATNEQATGYAQFNYGLWGRAAKALKDCGVNPGTAITTRREALAKFIAYATDSFGRLHQLGDSEMVKTTAIPGTPFEYPATLGTKGTRPTQRVAIYKAGYVFGRTGWGETRPFAQESTYSIRFGPGRILHGHNDHTSIVYNSHGRPILIDPGYTGYEKDKWQVYAKSSYAHNMLTTEEMNKHAPETKLDRSEINPTSEFYELSDEPAPGMTRRRGVLVLKNPDLLVTLDRATSSQWQEFQTQWHLPADQKVNASGPTTAVAQKPGDKVKTVLLQLPYQDTLPADSLKVATGQADPVQGWQFSKITTKNPAPTVLFKRQGNSATVLSLIIPAATKAAVTYKTRWQGSTYLIDLTIGTTHTTIGVLPDGTLTRVK